MKWFLLFLFVLVVGCSSNNYIPPASGPTAVVDYSIKDITASSLFDARVKGFVYVFEDSTCSKSSLAVMNFPSSEGKKFVVKANEPITLSVRVVLATNDGAYNQINTISFVPQRGKNYDLKTIFLINPLDPISYRTSTSIVDLVTGKPIQFALREKMRESPYICVDKLEDINLNDYVEKTPFN